jgi:hypothetical protein
MTETPKDNILAVRLDFDVQGVGRWQRDLSVYIPTSEQIAERAQMVTERSDLRANGLRLKK